MKAEATGADLRAPATRPMLDPAWTPAAAYSHAWALLAAPSTEGARMAGKKRTPDGKRTRELLRQLPSGYALEKRGGGHLTVLCPDGSELRDEKGLPVRVAGTSDSDSIRYDVARIRRALKRQGPPLLAVAVLAACFAAPARAAAPIASVPGLAQAISHRLDRHERRANRFLGRCLAPTSPVGVEAHSYDVAQGEFVAWWGAAEYQPGTVQVWWAHWPKRDHNPGLAGVIFSAYGVPVGSELYQRVDTCTSAAVERDS